VKLRAGFILFRMGPVAGFYEHSKEILDTIKEREFVD
jgi:hypothetical protein